MKVVAIVLLLAASVAAHAQPASRCDDRAGVVADRDDPCPVPPETRRPEPNPASGMRRDVPAGALGDWHMGEPVGRQPWTRKEPLTIARQVQARQLRLDALLATQHAANRQRCASALRVAETCGKFAGVFYCDEKGFQPVAQEARPPPVVRDNEARYAMERCAIEAARREH